MTTIAYKNGFIAADRQAQSGGTRTGIVTKIGRNNRGDLIGGSGDAPLVVGLIRWFLAGELVPPNLHHKCNSEEYDIVALIVRTDGSLIRLEPCGPIPFEADYTAMGSGQAFAHGAFAMGASAVQAVTVAALFDVNTGPVVESLELGVVGDPFPKLQNSGIIPV